MHKKTRTLKNFSAENPVIFNVKKYSKYGHHCVLIDRPLVGDARIHLKNFTFHLILFRHKNQYGIFKKEVEFHSPNFNSKI